jgi:hypothetical protein
MPLTIYIPLQGEGTEVWRPVEAEHVGDDRYRILSLQPSDEIWPFSLNEIVRCERELLSGENCLESSHLTKFRLTKWIRLAKTTT